ncbi:unnamed protein product [Paramecium sonneborni]|uniref:THH1/TOM1/TOM3 domain-containing protein n=1 Tax=Paramecium sonneborni TaxID=65129 RepID=A0A8S1Q3L2_9CILI|nr:unnamed protein product [Paramecium sonneborni]
MKKSDYMVQELIDVTNLQECLLLILFTLIGLGLFWLIWRDYQTTKRIYIQRQQEKVDMLIIKRLLLVNVCAQTFSYFIECVGFAFIDNCETNNYFIFPMIYLICNVTYMTSLYICCWRSTVIWGQLVCLKLNISSQIFDFVKNYAIIEVLIILMNLLVCLFYFIQVKSVVSLIVSIISTLVLILFLVASYLFQKYIIRTQNEIPELTKRRVFISIIFLSCALSFRILWNILLMIQEINLVKILKYGDDNVQYPCSTPDGLNWFFYELIYFPIANLIPAFLFNRIYSPYRAITQNKLNRLINEE